MSILHRGKFELFPMRVLAFLAPAVASIVGVFASDTTPSKQLPPTSFEVLRPEWHDIDTVRGDIRLPWGNGMFNRLIRAHGFDGWEVDQTRSKVEPFKSFSARQWSEENTKGEKARDAVKELASGGRVFVEWQPKNEMSVYGRLEGPLWIVTKSGKVIELKQWAEQNGHVRK